MVVSAEGGQFNLMNTYDSDETGYDIEIPKEISKYIEDPVDFYKDVNREGLIYGVSVIAFEDGTYWDIWEGFTAAKKFINYHPEWINFNFDLEHVHLTGDLTLSYDLESPIDNIIMWSAKRDDTIEIGLTKRYLNTFVSRNPITIRGYDKYLVKHDAQAAEKGKTMTIPITSPDGVTLQDFVKGLKSLYENMKEKYGEKPFDDHKFFGGIDTDGTIALGS